MKSVLCSKSKELNSTCSTLMNWTGGSKLVLHKCKVDFREVYSGRVPDFREIVSLNYIMDSSSKFIISVYTFSYRCCCFVVLWFYCNKMWRFITGG